MPHALEDPAAAEAAMSKMEDAPEGVVEHKESEK